jgi:TRAP-type C4-dicarboxylate transport system substrate-binding protein
MAWVGARAFDRKSVTSFQALLAPLLVDSQDLQAKIFEEGIPKEMMSGLRKLDLLGVGVLPGPMRKMLGVEKPFTKPADFAGAVVGMQDSALSERSFTALGATPKMLPAGARLDGVDAYEQQLSSIWGNHYEESAGFVTSNLNLWPRPLVLLIGKTVYDDLTVNQQQALTGAADKAMLQTLHASRAEDSESANNLCREGLQFVDASARDLQSLERAWTPVYDELRANPDTNKWIDRISALKTSLNVAADAVHCGTAAPQEGSDESAGSQLEGTWTTTLTESDWVEWPAGGPTGIWTLTFQDGVVTVTEPAGDLGYRASYRAFRDRIETSGGPDDLTATFSVDGDRLTLSDIKSPGCSDCRPYVVVWGSHPWVRR